MSILGCLFKNKNLITEIKEVKDTSHLHDLSSDQLNTLVTELYQNLYGKTGYFSNAKKNAIRETLVAIGRDNQLYAAYLAHRKTQSDRELTQTLTHAFRKIFNGDTRIVDAKTLLGFEKRLSTEIREVIFSKFTEKEIAYFNNVVTPSFSEHPLTLASLATIIDSIRMKTPNSRMLPILHKFQDLLEDNEFMDRLRLFQQIQTDKEVKAKKEIEMKPQSPMAFSNELQLFIGQLLQTERASSVE